MEDLLGCAPLAELRDGTGRLVVHVPRPAFVVTRIEGHFSSAIAERFEQCLDPEIRRGAFVGFHDWTEATTFDVSVPPRLAAWTVARLPRIARIVIATRHPIMGMAVRTTNLTIKRIEHLEERERWTDAVRTALASAPRSTPPSR